MTGRFDRKSTTCSRLMSDIVNSPCLRWDEKFVVLFAGPLFGRQEVDEVLRRGGQQRDEALQGGLQGRQESGPELVFPRHRRESIFDALRVEDRAVDEARFDLKLLARGILPKRLQ